MFLLFKTLLRVLRQSISSSVSLTLTIINLEMVIKKFLDLADLFEAQTLCVYELVEFVIVSKHKDFMLRTL